MATWDNDKQFGPTPVVAGTLEEKGYPTVAAADVDGASLSIATKLSKVKGGVGISSDGCTCFAEAQAITDGVVVFTRCGPITDDEPVLYYTLWGV